MVPSEDLIEKFNKGNIYRLVGRFKGNKKRDVKYQDTSSLYCF